MAKGTFYDNVEDAVICIVLEKKTVIKKVDIIIV